MWLPVFNTLLVFLSQPVQTLSIVPRLSFLLFNFRFKGGRKLRSIVEKLYSYLACWQVLFLKKGERNEGYHATLRVVRFTANKPCYTSRRGSVYFPPFHPWRPFLLSLSHSSNPEGNIYQAMLSLGALINYRRDNSNQLNKKTKKFEFKGWNPEFVYASNPKNNGHDCQHM